MESTPLVQTSFKPDRNKSIDLFSPIVPNTIEHNSSENVLSSKSERSYGLEDMSTWLGGE